MDIFFINNEINLIKLYDSYYKPLLYFVDQYVKDISSAEDIVAECFVKIWNYKDKFEDVESIRSFLYVTAKNSSLNYLRKIANKTEHVDIQKYCEEIWEDAEVLQKIIKTEILKDIFEEIEKLPIKQRQVFKLSYIEDKSLEEICQLLHMNESSVYTNRSRALSTLKKALAHQPLLLTMFLNFYIKN